MNLDKSNRWAHGKKDKLDRVVPTQLSVAFAP
jgi:hypothetical protein